MKAIQSLVVSAALAIAMAAPAVAGINDPEVLIYRFPGVRDNGAAIGEGVATVFHCTNFSGVTENIRLVTRGADGTLLQNTSTPILHLSTNTWYTHAPNAYGGINHPTNHVTQGTTAIAATSINIICTAVTIDASTIAPVGVALRGIRFSPVPGSQE